MRLTESECRRRSRPEFYTTKAAGKGTGLGLSVSLAIINQMKGWLNVYSEEGKGTSFRIYIPVLDKAGDVSVHTDDKTIHMNLYGEKNKRILLAEDNHSLRKMIVKALSGFGYDVVEAANGEEACKIAEKDSSFNFLITDMMMDGIDGVQLTQYCKRKMSGIKVIMMSGYSRQRTGINELEEGADIYYLQKPLDMGKLAAILSEQAVENE